MDITVPGSVNLNSRMNQRDVVDTAFLPPWMYHYPKFLRESPLEIDVRNDIKELSSIDSLRPALTTVEKDPTFDTLGVAIPFKPAVIDSGTKKRTSTKDSLGMRPIRINGYYDRSKFWERLVEPRTSNQAKKRLIELSSLDKESVLISWLTAPEEERSHFMEFFRRHEATENFFGERAHWQGNIWETELHLGYYRWPKQDERGTSTTLRGFELIPVAMSFRFVGDLRDRFWTCYFFSSTSNKFKGLADERYPGDKKDEAYSDKLCQRKLLELVYVVNALSEIRQSIGEITTKFEKELDETLNPQNDGFQFAHDHSSRPLKAAMDTLDSVSEKLTSSISIIEQWEKREDTRGIRSRWSLKDQNRYGARIGQLTRECESNVHQLRMQQSRLSEQKRAAEQRYGDLVSLRPATHCSEHLRAPCSPKQVPGA